MHGGRNRLQSGQTGKLRRKKFRGHDCAMIARERDKNTVKYRTLKTKKFQN